MAWFQHRFQPPPWMPSCSTYLFSPPWSPQASCDFNVFLLRSPLWSAKQLRSFNTFLVFALSWSPQPSRDFSTWFPPLVATAMARLQRIMFFFRLPRSPQQLNSLTHDFGHSRNAFSAPWSSQPSRNFNVSMFFFTPDRLNHVWLLYLF